MKKRFVNIENGKKVEYEILMQFTSKKTLKKYLIYTNNKKNKDGLLEIFVSNYRMENNNYFLYPIENQEEIDMCNGILNDLRDKLS